MIPPDGYLLSQRFPRVDFSDGSDSGLHLQQNHLFFDFVQFMDNPVQSLFYCGRHGKPPLPHSFFFGTSQAFSPIMTSDCPMQYRDRRSETLVVKYE
jgi:hypothetical protein